MLEPRLTVSLALHQKPPSAVCHAEDDAIIRHTSMKDSKFDTVGHANPMLCRFGWRRFYLEDTNEQIAAPGNRLARAVCSAYRADLDDGWRQGRTLVRPLP